MAIKAGVGVSDNISGIIAIEEAIKKSLQKIGTKTPKLLILLTSINYENELKPILKKAKELLPKTKIVGGTGAAILSSEGVYVRGIGVMSLDGDLEIGIGLGENSRTTPEIAGETSMRNALKDLGKSKYKNKIGILFVSGMKFPNIPGMNPMMHMKITKSIFKTLCNFMAKLGTGPARYEEGLEGANKEAKGEIQLFGAGAFDDFKGRRNYQFIEDKFYTDSIITLLIASNNETQLDFKHGLKPTGRKMEITSAKGSLAFEINGKPAWEEFKRIYNIPKELELQWKNNPVAMTTGEVPAEKDKEGNYWILAPLCVVGDAILFAKNVEEKTLYLCKGSGKEILLAADEVSKKAAKIKNKNFALVFSPVPRVMTMMENIDVEREYIKNNLKDTPWLGFYCCASEVAMRKKSKKKNDFLKCLNETIAIATSKEK
jgi:hypothetical protein